MEKVIKQDYMYKLELFGDKGETLHIKQNNECVVIEPKSIPELLKFIKENYNL